MTNEQGLKTLGDYRRTAKDSLFGFDLFSECKSTSVYDAITTALVISRGLISVSRIQEIGTWDVVFFPKTKYEMKNAELFYCIKLMEFAITYNKAESINDLFPNWPKRPDVNARVFTAAGISFLEAAFNFVLELGSDIIGILQDAYKKYTKEGHVIYRDPFMFLNKTPTVDNLEINPVPDIIIKTWYDEIIKGVQRGFPENEFSWHKVTTEFNSLQKQLEYERDVWKSGEAGGTERESVKLKTVHKALIKALSTILETGNTIGVTRDALVRKTNYTVGSGTVNQAYIDLKTWGIITQDGQTFTPNFQDYKQNPPN